MPYMDMEVTDTSGDCTTYRTGRGLELRVADGSFRARISNHGLPEIFGENLEPACGCSACQRAALLRRPDPDLDLPLGELWEEFGRAAAEAGLPWIKSYFPAYRHALGVTRDTQFCECCEEPQWLDELQEDGSWVDGELVCASCIQDCHSFCETCSEWYHHDTEDDHDHDDDEDDDSCGCASPQTRFAVRNDGREPLANDTRATVTLAGGIISDEGIAAIRDELWRHACTQGDSDLMGKMQNLAYDLHELGSEWQTSRGNYTKRLSRLAYQRYGAKLAPEVVSQVGCIASDHSKAVDYEIDVTRKLNMSAADFYHEDSCWWGSYSKSRCALKTNGGFGLRSLSGAFSVTGRAWVMPLRKKANGQLTPTFETMTPDAFVVFNGYGDLSGYQPARIMAHMAGWTYSKIDFECSPMYVNSGGYLVADEETVRTVKSLYLDVDRHSYLFETERELANAA